MGVVVKGVCSLDAFDRTESFDDYFSNEDVLEINGYKLKFLKGEFWTSKQRQGSSIHEISYRACFKSQLPLFFIQKLTNINSVIFDPFMGRGTTVVEGVLNGRRSIGMDVNPLSEILTLPRINIPQIKNVFDRIDSIELQQNLRAEIDLSMFYHPATESELVSLKNYLSYRKEEEQEDNVDKWIRMVATNRLSGHSAGFFSVYTLPPNQATTPEEQIRINEKRQQKPEYRDIKKLIKKNTLSLLKDFNEDSINKINSVGLKSELLVEDSRISQRHRNHYLYHPKQHTHLN